jgi:hypothetical protein
MDLMLFMITRYVYSLFLDLFPPFLCCPLELYLHFTLGPEKWSTLNGVEFAWLYFQFTLDPFTIPF